MIIFLDLDGPILDVKDRYYTIYKELVKSGEGFPISKRAYWQMKRRGITDKDILRTSFLETDAFDTYEKKREKMLEHPRYLKLDKLHNNITLTLERMKKEHTVVLVTARNNKDTLNKQLDTLKLDKYFDKVLTTNQLKHSNIPTWKAKYLLIKPQIRKNRNAIIITDSESDIRAGKKARIPVYGVLSGIRSRQLLKRAGVDRIIKSLVEVTFDDKTQRRDAK